MIRFGEVQFGVTKIKMMKPQYHPVRKNVAKSEFYIPGFTQVHFPTQLMKKGLKSIY